jgi:hypothetical protein
MFVIKSVNKFVMILVTSLGQAFVHGICLMHHRLPQGKQGRPGVTCSKLVALRAGKKSNLALGVSRVAYCPGCPGVSQGIQGHPRVTQGSLVTKAIFLMGRANRLARERGAQRTLQGTSRGYETSGGIRMAVEQQAPLPASSKRMPGVQRVLPPPSGGRDGAG